MVGGLQDRGREFWPNGSSQLCRWEKGCDTLRSFLNRLGARRDLDKQDLATAMREFIQEFEHTTGRLYQMLYGAVENPDDDPRVAEVFDWFNFVFRSAIYALLSGWIGDKQDDYRINLNPNPPKDDFGDSP